MPPAPPTAKVAGNPLKKMPKWGWLAAGGAVLGIGYSLYRDKHAQAPAPDTAGQTDPTAIDPTTGQPYGMSVQPSPAGVVYPGAAPADSGATVGSVGQTALETGIGGITGVIEALPGLITALNPVGVEPPHNPAFPATPAPAPATPVPRPPGNTPPVPPGYHKGNSIHGKVFPGAYCWAHIGGRPGVEYYHVRFTNHVLQRWHYDSAGKHKGAWKLHWQGRW